MKIVFKTLFVVVCIVLLVNKFYVPTFCDGLSGKSIKNSLGATDGIKRCEDHKVCKIGDITDSILGGKDLKVWKCVPAFGDIEVGKYD